MNANRRKLLLCGLQPYTQSHWIPAFAGMTGKTTHHSSAIQSTNHLLLPFVHLKEHLHVYALF